MWLDVCDALLSPPRNVQSDNFILFFSCSFCCFVKKCYQMIIGCVLKYWGNFLNVEENIFLWLVLSYGAFCLSELMLFWLQERYDNNWWIQGMWLACGLCKFGGTYCGSNKESWPLSLGRGRVSVIFLWVFLNFKTKCNVV